MSRSLRRWSRRWLVLAPVVAVFGGQALAASNLRVPFLPPAGTTPALPPSAAALADGIAALRGAVARARRAELAARAEALLAAIDGPVGTLPPVAASRSHDIVPPGHRGTPLTSDSDVSHGITNP